MTSQATTIRSIHRKGEPYAGNGLSFSPRPAERYERIVSGQTKPSYLPRRSRLSFSPRPAERYERIVSGQTKPSYLPRRSFSAKR